MTVHPHTRGVFLLAACLGVLLSTGAVTVLIGYVLILFVTGAVGRVKQHLKVALTAGIPFLLMLSLVYLVILESPDKSQVERLEYILFIFLRVMMVTASFQLVFAMNSVELLTFLRRWGFRGHALLIVMGTFSLWKDFLGRAEKLFFARLAGGHFTSRSLVNRLTQLPFLFLPLVYSSLVVAIERSESWGQLDVDAELSRITVDSEGGFHGIGNTLWVSVIVIWAGVIIILELL